MKHGSLLVGRVEDIAYFLRIVESAESKHKSSFRQKEKKKSYHWIMYPLTILLKPRYILFSLWEAAHFLGHPTNDF